jgi:hypothetical protein
MAAPVLSRGSHVVIPQPWQRGTIEYGSVSATRWRSLLTTERDEPAFEPTEAIIYCSECAAREFGCR